MKLEDKYADDEGVKIHYVVSGPADAPLVVMIHGYPDYSETWAQLTPVLNDAYRTVAVDTRGYNLSDKPKGVENYDMTKLVADIASVIKNEGRDKAIVIGHDWGAAQAWAFEFAHPEMVDKLIILSVPHPTAFAHELATNKVQYEHSQYARNFQKAGSEGELTAEGLAGWVKDPAEKAKYVEAFKRSDFAAMMNYYRANYPSGTNQPAPDAPLPNNPPINVPVMVIHGIKDQALLASGHSGTWNYVTKDTTLLMIPDAGHFVQHDAADLVNKSIRAWLDVHK
ncbi:MAG: alpha/beta fold hydrolase [Alphaproteobacteria bacterium]|nr:alpha/beta fold hydrolase [Alphaproteobacteria bacterium]